MNGRTRLTREHANSPPRVSIWYAAALAGVCVLSFVFPGDVPWVNDEPSLIGAALDANAVHRLAGIGLPWSSHLHYGPAAVWVCQAMLLITHHPMVLVAMRAALVAGGTALAMVWLGRSLKLWRWFAVVILLSPYLWVDSRLLSGKTFNIPLCALLLAGYADFLSRDRSDAQGRRHDGGLLVALIAAVTMFLIHPTAIALVAPLALHVLLLRPRALLGQKWAVLAIAMVCVLLPWGYWRQLHYPSSTPLAGPAGWIFPLLSPRLLSAAGLHHFLGSAWQDLAGPAIGAGLQSVQRLTLLAFPLVWAGMIIAVVRSVRLLRRPSAASAADHMALLGLAAFIGQIILDGCSRIEADPHHYNATWAVYALLAWLSADALVKSSARWSSWIAALLALQGAALAAVTVYIMLLMHIAGGTRGEHYGATLANQLEVAIILNRYPDNMPVRFQVANLAKFPIAMQTLRRLARDIAHPQPASAGGVELIVYYRSGLPRSGWIMVAEMKGGI